MANASPRLLTIRYPLFAHLVRRRDGSVESPAAPFAIRHSLFAKSCLETANEKVHRLVSRAGVGAGPVVEDRAGREKSRRREDARRVERLDGRPREDDQ